MDASDRRIRNRTYALYVEHGRAPAPVEVGPGTEAAWRRLHDQHALVLDDDGGLRMLNPFSVAPTPYLVEAAGRSWYGNPPMPGTATGSSPTGGPIHGSRTSRSSRASVWQAISGTSRANL
jgi:hypothetical protein